MEKTIIAMKVYIFDETIPSGKSFLFHFHLKAKILFSSVLPGPACQLQPILWIDVILHTLSHQKHKALLHFLNPFSLSGEFEPRG